MSRTTLALTAYTLGTVSPIALAVALSRASEYVSRRKAGL
jgi:cytochrome c biogenesis protein CcdA